MPVEIGQRFGALATLLAARPRLIPAYPDAARVRACLGACERIAERLDDERERDDREIAARYVDHGGEG